MDQLLILLFQLFQSDTPYLIHSSGIYFVSKVLWDNLVSNQVNYVITYHNLVNTQVDYVTTYYNLVNTQVDYVTT